MQSLDLKEFLPDEDSWKYFSEKNTFAISKDRSLEFDGVVVACANAKEHFLRASFESDVFRNIRFRMWVAVSLVTRIDVVVNGQRAARCDLEPNNDDGVCRLHRVETDITSLVERTRESELLIHIKFAGDAIGRVSLALYCTDPANPTTQLKSLAPLIEQRWGRRSFCAVLIALFVWLACLLAMYLFGSQAISKLLKSVFGFSISNSTWTFLFGALPLLLKLLDFPFTRDLSIRKWFRSGMAFALRKPRSILAGALCASAVLGFWVWQVQSDMAHVRDYRKLIVAYLDNPYEDKQLREAFKENPWRVEAQFLIARHSQEVDDGADYVAALREGKNPLSEILEEKNLASHRRLLGDGNIEYSQDPVLWYAGILPEADASESTHQPPRKYTQEAVDILKTASPTGLAAADFRMRKLLQLVLEYDLHEANLEDAIQKANSDDPDVLAEVEKLRAKLDKTYGDLKDMISPKESSVTLRMQSEVDPKIWTAC